MLAREEETNTEFGHMIIDNLDFVAEFAAIEMIYATNKTKRCQNIQVKFGRFLVVRRSGV